MLLGLRITSFAWVVQVGLLACATAEQIPAGPGTGAAAPFAGAGGAAGSNVVSGGRPSIGGASGAGGAALGGEGGGSSGPSIGGSGGMGGSAPASGGSGGRSGSAGVGGGGGAGGSDPRQELCQPPLKLCGGLCIDPAPQVGCGPSECTPCPAPAANGEAICTGDACDFICDAGFVKSSGTSCVAASGQCANGVLDGTETDVDCGGGCGACGEGQSCAVDADCLLGPCESGICGCTPTLSCGANSCGSLDDLCGPIDCGGCTAPATCGGANVANQCGTPAPGGNCSSAGFDGHLYWFCLDNSDWDPAQAACASVGGHLAVISSAAEQDFIVQEAGSNQWLIGLNKKNVSGQTAPGTWEWVDGSDPNTGYTNWNSGEPDSNDCGAMNANGTWRDWNCGNGENWICEIE